MEVTLPWQPLDGAADELPFPHIMVDEFLPAGLFDRLAATFPDCPPGSGPTGFTIHPGDAAFDALVAENADWASLAQACDSEAFIRFALMPFRKCLADEAVAACRMFVTSTTANRAPTRSATSSRDRSIRRIIFGSVSISCRDGWATNAWHISITAAGP